MINLAPWRYRRVLAVNGGPIERIEMGVISVLGESQYQANAYLKSGLRQSASKKVVYGNADGTGTARTPGLARHKAISECLERWAHASMTRTGAKFGFNVDPSSTGMAAFPGLVKSQARSRALSEAVERDAVISWWSGCLDAEVRTSPWAGVDLYEIESPKPGIKVALVHASAGHHLHAYGHAAATTLENAAHSAAVEMVRAQLVLGRFERRSNHGAGDHPSDNLFERRCLFFASAEGNALFQERLQRRKHQSRESRLLVDGEIRGPWSDYATVWRALFEPADPQFLAPREDYFFW